jgi:sigma-B regulation protein RsbU (phosphoserine phosphatase)
MPDTHIVETISDYSLFRNFTAQEIQDLLVSCEVKPLEPGDVLINPETHNDTLYLVIDGELEITLEQNGAQVFIPIQAGEILGEMSLIMGDPTSALVTAKHASRILHIPEKTFWDKLAVNKKGVRNLMSMMVLRQKRTNSNLIAEVEEQIKYRHLEKELETAGKIQANIVPDGNNLLPNRPEVDVYALMNQARVVGGDFYDAIVLDDERVYLAIGDVSGKGMPAALFMVRTFTSLRMMVSSDHSFEDVIPAVNKLLMKNNDDMMFVSVFAGVLNVRTGLFRYINGGHNPPFISRSGEDFQLLDVPKGTVLGILDSEQFQLIDLYLEPGDSLVMFTDGIPEATRQDKAPFGLQRMEAVLNEKKREPMKTLIRGLETAVAEFVGQAPPHDDLTLLGVRYSGQSSGGGMKKRI